MPGKQKVLLAAASLLASHNLYADPLVTPNFTVVPHDQPYYTQDVGNTRLIFTEANQAVAEKAAGVELKLHPIYEESFGYKMDTRLSVGLMSSYNQIANGFSTQFPWNRQINYIGGAQMPDYFASDSWLLTLLAHETTHNYQLNAKDNVVSRSLFNILGNGALFSPIIPAITPNMFESSFMLEGNAVLNESRHGMGGRLYSGRFRALALAQAQAGYLTPERVYNNTLFFPYGEHFYTLGSSFQYYLAERYGVDTANKYFKSRSKYWVWPFFANKPMTDAFGKDFVSSVADWAAEMKQQAQSMTVAKGQAIARSKYVAPLNEQNGKIVFLVNTDGVSRPSLISYDTASGQTSKKGSGHQMGKLFEDNGTFYSVGSDHTSPWRIYQGLYDGGSQIREETRGKVVQGYLPDGKMAYFDVASSFINPQLYVGDEFYASVNSSVLVKGNDIYYCTQNGRTRTLYRNKAAIYSFESFYGFPVDVDAQGSVYFIANSEFGSTLYRTHEGKAERVLAADNVIDARLAANGNALVTAISADDYYYSLENLQPAAATPYAIKLLWDTDGSTAVPTAAAPVTTSTSAADQSGNADAQAQGTDAPPAVNTAATVTHIGDAAPQPLTLENPYGLFSNVRYSGTNIILSTETDGEDANGDTKAHSLYDISINFEDPLTRSSYSLWAKRDEDLSQLAGVGLSNSQFFLLAGLQAYYVLDHGDKITDNNIPARDHGIAAELRLPFLDQGYWTAELASTYFQDYKTLEREPVSLQLNAGLLEQHGQSWLPNREAAFSAYGVKERSDMISGGKLHFTWGLPYQLYLEAGGQYSGSDATSFGGIDDRGVELTRSSSNLNNDPSRFVIPSLTQDFYVQSASMAGASITKVFDLSSYFFTFPLSLRREALMLGYRHYDIDDEAGAGRVKIGQAVLGLDIDVLVLNMTPLTFALEAVYNDDTQLTDRKAFQGRLEIAF